MWEGYFKDLMASTADAYGAGATLDEAKEQVAPGLVARWGSRFPAGAGSSEPFRATSPRPIAS